MARNESVLTQSEKESFEIEYFIFHIIINGEPHPVYLEEVTLEVEQLQFFKKRFSDISEGIQYTFTDRENSGFYQDCLLLMNDPESQFLDISKRLALSFQNSHVGNTLDGAFIISLVKVDNNRRLLFLLKIDNNKVYQYKIDQDHHGLLTEITNTFIEDKKAIQKSALIDVTDHYIWDVLATDRSGDAQQPIRDFFLRYLTVVPRQTASILTMKVMQTVKNWAINNKESLGLKEDVAVYKRRAVDYLRSTANYQTDECIRNIFRDEEAVPELLERFTVNLKSAFDQAGISGQQFVPNQRSLTNAVLKNIRQTAEGVKIEWEGDMSDHNIIIPTTRSEDGYFYIRIKTSRIDILDKGN